MFGTLAPAIHSGHSVLRLSHSLSFSREFFEGDRSARIEHLRSSRRPASICQAILSLSHATWGALAEQVFGVDPLQLDVSMVLCKIEETNTCLNLDSPVEVFIDPAGDFTLLVYDLPAP